MYLTILLTFAKKETTQNLLNKKKMHNNADKLKINIPIIQNACPSLLEINDLDQIKPDKFICHHCKFIGKEEFFYKCTQRIVQSRNKEYEELKKSFFNIKNSLFVNCNKLYCLLCVQNCYYQSLKKYFVNSWVCPFCIVVLLGNMLLSFV